MPEKLVSLYSDPSLSIASLGTLYVNVATGPMSLEHVATLSRTSQAMIGKQAGNICNLSVITVADVRQDPDVRKEMTKLMNDINKRTAASALVFTGGGLVGTVLRATVSAIMIAARAQFPLKTFAQVDDGMTWLSGFMVPTPSIAERAAYVRQVSDLHRQCLETRKLA